ncbi:GNAT family N-acetyltransferase [Microvirga sp. CF3016]|uniref:GNAT family N-acetyltransferase n=1 Tax=Microvirga sp. CF3016 TaxID=3110181 RepID=UPI002E75A4C4|nr:GNAT family N-acetyltransferase [Microvirga sp. CF3016]MEE1613012.1 GNAT family N-acetyltransferase [Microvirga sp. CF3016]
MSELQIETVSAVTPELVEGVNRLLPQLTSSPKTLSWRDLEAIVASSSSLIILARCDQEPAGMLTLGWFSAPTGPRAFIDDVVIDERYRGRGIGEALVRSALDHARRLGANTVDLTSRPAREAANRLYRRIGFEQRETNSYRYRFDAVSG